MRVLGNKVGPPMKFRCSLIPALLFCAAPAFAGVVVSTPNSGAELGSPFHLSASSPYCSSQSIVAMGYSLDSNRDAMVVNAASIDTDVHVSLGTHVLHVKAWGRNGSACVKTIAITIVTQPSGGGTGSITVATPTAGAEVSSPFTLSASAGTCSSRQVVSMGYSLDSSSSTAAFNGNGIDTQVTAA